MSSGWPTVQLADVLQPVARPEIPQPGTRYRQLGVKLWGEGAYEREPVDGAETKYATLSQVDAGDVVVNKIWARNGSVAVVQEKLAGCFVSGEFPTFVANRERLLPEWMHWLTKTPGLWKQCDEKSRGTSGQNRIRPEQFLRVEIPLPPVGEQRRIVARIETLAAHVSEARLIRLEATREAEALIASQISALWDNERVWGRVSDAVSDQKNSVRSGPFGSQLLHEEFVTSGVAAIGTRDVQTHRFDLRSGWFVTADKFEHLRRYQVFPGDVLGTIVGASIGRFCVVPPDVPLAFTTKHVQALTLNLSIAEPSFVSLMLNFHRRCRQSLFSQVEGSAQPSLNAAKILGTALPLPPVAAQRRTVIELNGLRTQVDRIKELQAGTAAELDALMPAILDRAFKGEL